MSTPIDELLITVEIEQGSNLEELHSMLKEFQSLGGKLEVEVDLSEVLEIKDIVVSAHEKINALTNILIPIVTKYEPLLESIQELINDNFQEISKDINTLLEWKDKLNTDNSSILNSIQSILKTIEILSQNIEKFQEKDYYKKIIEILNDLTKNVKNVFQEQVFDEIKNKIDDIRQHVDKNLLDEIKTKIEGIIDNLPKNVKNYMKTFVANKVIKALTKVITDKSITFDEIKKIVDDVFGGMRTGAYYGGTTRYGLDEDKVEEMLLNVKHQIIDYLQFFMNGQAQVNRRILNEINEVYKIVSSQEPSKGIDTNKILSLFKTIQQFVLTGSFETSQESLHKLGDAIEQIRLDLMVEGAKKLQSVKILEEIEFIKKYLENKITHNAAVWAVEGELTSVHIKLNDTISGILDLPSKLEQKLLLLKVKLAEDLEKIIGGEFNQLYETIKAVFQTGKKTDLPEELQFIKGMLNEISQYVVMDWIEELGVLTREIEQILEDFGASLRDIGGAYNTLVHVYIKQEDKLDNLTNLLEGKIEAEKQEFSDLREYLNNFDIPEKFDVLHERIDNLGEILGVPGGMEEILDGVNYIWEKIRNLLHVLRMNDKILEVLKEIPNIERMGSTAESLEALMDILSTAQDVKEALLMWRSLITGARAGLRNISHVSQIIEIKKVLELEKVTMASRSEDIGIAIEDQIIRPYGKVWNKIEKTTDVIERKIEDINYQREADTQDRLNKTKLEEK